LILDRTKKEIKKGSIVAITFPSGELQDGKVTRVDAVSSLQAGRAVNKLYIELVFELPSHPQIPHSILANMVIVRDPEEESKVHL